MGYKVMVVDDERVLAEMLCKLLESDGYKTCYAVNGYEAIKIIEKSQEKPDVVLTDLVMPEMDGLELQQRINELFPEIGVIIITAYATVETSVKALKRGAFDYISKPYTIEKITESLSRYFEQRRLEKENISLRKLNEMKDKFMALASHELNTPLMVIRGYLDILQQDASLNDRYLSCVKGAQNACSRLTSIVNDLRYLTYSRADLAIENLCINCWVEEVLEPYRFIVKKRNQNLITKISPDPLYINGDLDALKQIIHHLISNAIKFTPDGGSITVGIQETKEKEDKYAEFFCKDTGDGIDSNQIGNIFEAFYTAMPIVHHHTAVNYEYRGGGIGNGLAIVRHLAEIQDGKVFVSSILGKGSHFRVLFPCVDESATP